MNISSLRSVRPLRRSAAAAATLTLALALTACGGSDSDDESDDNDDRGSEPTSEVIPADELEEILLSAEDLGSGYQDDPDTEEDDDTFDGTCFAANFDDISGGPESEASKRFAAESGEAQSFLKVSLESYEDADELAGWLEEYQASFEDCPSVQATSEDGVTFALDFDVDDTVSADGADQQLNIYAEGTVTLDSGTVYPIAFSAQAARHGNSLAAVTQQVINSSTAGSLDFGSAGGYLSQQYEALVGLTE